jgi:amino acid permease
MLSAFHMATTLIYMGLERIGFDAIMHVFGLVRVFAFTEHFCVIGNYKMFSPLTFKRLKFVVNYIALCAFNSI